MMARRYRKKPVVIEAMHWDGSIQSADAIEAWSGGATRCRAQSDMTLWIFIETIEGEMRAGPGDWIIRGVRGEFYPCKNEIFEQTYEVVE